MKDPVGTSYEPFYKKKMDLTLKYQNLMLQFWFQIDNVALQHHRIPNPDQDSII